VWLNTMKDVGPSIDIEGYALSSDAVATLIANLQKRAISRTSKSRKLAGFIDQGNAGVPVLSLTCEKGPAPSSASAGDKSQRKGEVLRVQKSWKAA